MSGETNVNDHCGFFVQIKPSLEKEKDPMAGIMDMMKVSLFSF